MAGQKSTLRFMILLSAISMLIIGAMIGCNEKKITSPLTGPAAGSGPIGGGDTQKMKLTASPSGTLVVTGNETQATTKITAQVNNSIGQPMPDGTVVHWSATVGTLDAATQTASNGAATVSLTFPTSYSGCSTVSAESGDVSNLITVCVSRRDPTPTPTVTPTPSKELILSVGQSAIIAKGTTDVLALVTTNGTPEEGVLVTFSASGGGALNPNAALTNSNGFAKVTFTGNNSSTSDITAMITARTGDGRTGNVTVIVSKP